MTRILLTTFALAAALIAAAYAQILGGNTSLAVTTTASRAQLPASLIRYPYALIIPAPHTVDPAAPPQEIFYSLGNSSVTATLNSASFPTGGICLNLNGNGYISAIASTGIAKLRITQLSACALFSTAALAWPVHGSAGATGTFLGTNLSVVSDSSPEQPFLNVFKTGSAWLPGTAGSTDTHEQGKIAIDADGWVTSLSPIGGGTFDRVRMRLFNSIVYPSYSSGQYVVLYDGTGTIDCTQAPGGDATLVSSVPGRMVVNVATPSTNGFSVTIMATNASPNHVRNIRVVRADREALLNSGAIFNPDFISRIGSFHTLRFETWVGTFQNTPTQTWAGRTKTTQAFWGISAVNGVQAEPVTPTANAYGGGVNLGVGPPVEIMIALSNQIGANFWFNFPDLADDAYFTGVANLIKTGGGAPLNSSLKAYFEVGDELWSSVEPANTDYIARGKTTWPPLAISSITWAAGVATATTAAPIPSNMNVLTVFDIAGATPSGYNATAVTLTFTGASTFTYPVAVDPGGTGTGAAYYFSYSFPGNYRDSYYAKRTSNMSDIMASVLGTDFPRAFPLINCQAGFAVTAQIFIGAAAGVNNINGPISANVKGLAIAPYFGGEVGLPGAWTADADGGLTKYFNYITSGGTLPVQSGSPAVTAGTSTNLTLTSGQSFPSTPANGTILQWKINWSGGSNGDPMGSNPHIIVDGGTSYPLLDYQGSSLPTGYFAPYYNLQSNFVFTSATGTKLVYYSEAGGNFAVGDTITGGTSGSTGTVAIVNDYPPTGEMIVHNASGAFMNGETITAGAVTATVNGTTATITAGWRPTIYGRTIGAIQQASDDITVGGANSYVGIAAANNLVLLGYESGAGGPPAGFDDSAWAPAYWTANKSDARMGTLYNSYIPAMKAAGLTVMNHYQDIGVYGDSFGFWGALENVLQTSSPRFDALVAAGSL